MIHDYGLPHLRGILHTEFNEYDSLIKPIYVWLKSQGVRFLAGATITDIAKHDIGGETLATGLTLTNEAGVEHLTLTRDDMVFFTIGSLTQNATMGDTHSTPSFDRETTNRECFTVWEKLAARDAKFGQPATFISTIDKSNWISFFRTITGDPTFFEFIEKKTQSSRHGRSGHDRRFKLADQLRTLWKIFPESARRRERILGLRSM